MLPKKNRVDTRSVKKIFQEGKFINSPNLTLKFLKNSDNKTRISFIAPKSLAKLAVKRNLLRRRGYKALEKYFKDFPLGLTGVFIFKKCQDDINIIEKEIESILHKIN